MPRKPRNELLAVLLCQAALVVQVLLVNLENHLVNVENHLANVEKQENLKLINGVNVIDIV